MPSATSETPIRAASLHDEGTDALDEAHRFLIRSEPASEQAITDTVRAFTELVRAFTPSVMLQPARAVDLSLQFLQYSLGLQRRLVFELVSGLQLALTEAGTDQTYERSDSATDGSRARSSRRSSNRS